MLWRAVSGCTVPWRSASELSRLHPKCPVGLVCQDVLHQEKIFASGCRGSVGMLNMRLKRLDARNANWQGILHPDDACQRTCRSERETPMHMRTRRRWAAHWPSGRSAPWHLPSERCTPRHLPSGREVSGHFSFRMQSVMAKVLLTMHAMASTFCTRSVGVFCLPDAECHGKHTTDNVCHGICLPGNARHGICLLDE